MNKLTSIFLNPRAWLAKLLLFIFILLFVGLGYFGYLEPIKAILDSEQLSFTIGEKRLSIYLLLKASITVVVLIWLVSIFSDFGETRIGKLQGFKPSNRTLMQKAFQIVVYFFAFVIGLDILGIDLTALAIFSGAIGIGIGFGLQKITSNFISGLILLFEKSIENDDLIELTDGTYGFIRHTGARYTLIETFEGKEIMIPNEDFITNRVTNWTFSNTRGRVEVNIGVSYDSDIELARKIMLETALEHPRTATEPEPACYLIEFADSSVNFQLFYWVADVTEGRLEPKSDVLRTIFAKFKDNNITIPFPQRDLHIKNQELLK